MFGSEIVRPTANAGDLGITLPREGRVTSAFELLHHDSRGGSRGPFIFLKPTFWSVNLESGLPDPLERRWMVQYPDHLHLPEVPRK